LLAVDQKGVKIEIRAPTNPEIRFEFFAESGHVIPALSGASIRAAHFCPSMDSSDCLIRPSTSRDARSEKVRNENPLPTAENPLRLLPAASCSTRNTVMSAFISALAPPSDRRKKTSI
jgi:hypothetical protein